MKQETNNEIDLLLRRMTRRNGDSMGDAHSDIDDHHLDADELSSYAQNALPPATRARYTEHLAECSTCRKIATQLALSLGTTVPATETVSAPSGLKAFLASLFTPMVLRYAVPALGLIVVAAIGFVVMRQPVSEMTARVNKEQPAGVATQPEGRVSEPSASPFAKADSASAQKPAREESAETAPQSKTAAAGAGTGPAPAKEPEAAAEAPPATTASVMASPKTASASDKETEKQEDETAPKKQPAPAQAPLVRDRKDDASGAFTVAGAENKARGQADSRGFIVGRPSTAAGTAPGTGGTATAKRSRSEKYENNNATTGAVESNETVETRSVAGRNFRKQRGIWVDTEYDSSTQTVNMARGSEQFRALVADEPTIGTIAKQLEGEVIVVWKGRAYRIR